MSSVDVNKSKCNGCGRCVKACPYDAITIVNGKAVIDMNLCTLCGNCTRECVQGALSIKSLSKDVDLSGYKGIWVVVEFFNDELRSTGFQLISKANQLAKESGDSVTAILVGNTPPRTQELKEAFAEYGVSQVSVIWHKDFTRFITEDASEAISAYIQEKQPRIVLFLGTVFGRTIAPQVATRVRTGLTADCTELAINEKNNLLQIRPTYGGKVLATIETPFSCPQMASVRPNVFVEEKNPIFVEDVIITDIPVKRRTAIALKELKKVTTQVP